MQSSLFQRFAGRRKGRPLHQGRAEALAHAERRFLIKPDSADQTLLDPRDLFTGVKEKIWVEIGFGNGEHMIGQAERNPQIGFIGCEPFINGVSAAAKEIVERILDNIRIWPDEALTFLNKFPDASVDRIFLLFSDPWPKTRQYKRRVIQTETVTLFARLLKPGGEVRLATDHDYLAEWMLLHMVQQGRFMWKNACNGDWRTVPDDWIETRYQQKAAHEGRPAYFMDFVRL
jgi:tRNA (guanine-N7-)-methyltransferase